jgi:hypothetical protein
MSEPTDQQQAAPPAPTPAEPVSLVGVPLPAELTQSDPALLVDSLHGSGAVRDAAARPPRG